MNTGHYIGPTVTSARPEDMVEELRQCKLWDLQINKQAEILARHIVEEAFADYIEDDEEGADVIPFRHPETPEF